MTTLHLVEGPVGAGKSTWARRHAGAIRAPFLCLDAWIARLFIPDRPVAAGVDWYLERRERCLEGIWEVARDVLANGQDVVLELGLVQAGEREAFCRRVDELTDVDLRIWILDAPVEERRERVQLRNAARGETWSVDITEAMFERANRWWEPPDEAECATRDVIFL